VRFSTAAGGFTTWRSTLEFAKKDRARGVSWQNRAHISVQTEVNRTQVATIKAGQPAWNSRNRGSIINIYFYRQHQLKFEAFTATEYNEVPRKITHHQGCWTDSFRNCDKPFRRTYMFSILHLAPRPWTCVTVPLRPRLHPVVLTPPDNFTAQYTVCDCRALRYRPTCHSKRPVALHSNFITCQHNAPEELLRRHTLGMATLSHRGDQPDPTQRAE
jgi:hypothetical protein